MKPQYTTQRRQATTLHQLTLPQHRLIDWKIVFLVINFVTNYLSERVNRFRFANICFIPRPKKDTKFFSSYSSEKNLFE